MMTKATKPHGSPAQAPRLRSGRAGFSLLEMLLVVAILLTVMAIAAPSLLRAIASYRLESNARGVSTLIQRARFEAMRRNRTTCTGFVDLGNEGRYIMDLRGATPDPCSESPPTINDGEPAVGTPSNVMWYSNGAPTLPPGFDGLPAGYNAATLVVPTDYRLIFSPRGTAMVDDGVGNLIVADSIQTICLLGRRDQNFPEVDDAVLITVTPIGNVKLFRWQRSTEFWMPL